MVLQTEFHFPLMQNIELRLKIIRKIDNTGVLSYPQDLRRRLYGGHCVCPLDNEEEEKPTIKSACSSACLPTHRNAMKVGLSYLSLVTKYREIPQLWE